MLETQRNNRFFVNMGILLLFLVIVGFGSAMFSSDTNPLTLPILYHIHAIFYLAWFSLFIIQARLIGFKKFARHKTLGYSSIFVIIGMLVTGIMMSAHSYVRGVSPVPDITLQNFLAFPMIDALGLVIFFSLGVLNRHNPNFHKHCMLIMSIVIMDPAIARLAMSLGFMPAALLIHIGLVVLVIWRDKRVDRRVHLITWLGLSWVILRLVFIFVVGATTGWASLMDMLFG